MMLSSTFFKEAVPSLSKWRFPLKIFSFYFFKYSPVKKLKPHNLHLLVEKYFLLEGIN